MVYAAGNHRGNGTPQEKEPFAITKSAGEREDVFFPTHPAPASWYWPGQGGRPCINVCRKLGHIGQIDLLE